MGDGGTGKTRAKLSGLSTRKPNRFDVATGPDVLAEMAEALNLPAIRKLTFAGDIRAEGRSGWRLNGQLGATAEQLCVITLRDGRAALRHHAHARHLARRCAGDAAFHG